MNKVPGTLLAVTILCACGIAQAAQTIWQPSDPGIAMRATEQQPGAYFSVDLDALNQRLRSAPHEVLLDFSTEIELPMPDGSLARFSLVESPIMQPGLAEKFPMIKTYRVFGIDDTGASGRVDISPRGFSAMLHTADGRIFIDPARFRDAGSLYLARYQNAIARQHEFTCGVHDLDFSRSTASAAKQQIAERIPGSFLKYRLAVSATAEYVAAVGLPGDVANAQAAIVTAINRVNEIYQRDLGIKLELVANNNQLIEKSGNVSFSNTNPFALFFENQCWTDTVIGETGYDIGHVFSTGGGGLATLGSVCSVTNKAKGVSGGINPVGDPFYIDFVAHEIGHQFSAEHSFNGTTRFCGGGNRYAPSAVEPGSGSTIMAYAGICADSPVQSENLQPNSDATFHARSIAEINAFTAGAGSCFVAETASNPNDPVIDPIEPFWDTSQNPPFVWIPANTPFALTGSASDADTDAIEYQWDQMDIGTATNATTFGTDLGDNPLFRSYPPQPVPMRDFPAMGTQVTGKTDEAEVLPSGNREMNLRLTARDGKSGQDTLDLLIKVAGSAGPFRVVSQSADTIINFTDNTFTVSWNVANTNLAPVSCANVAIELIAFDSEAYTRHTVHTLVPSTPNVNGSAIVSVPSQWIQYPSRGRLRVRCLDNIFYALSEGDLQFIGDIPRTDFDDSAVATFFNDIGFSCADTQMPNCGYPRPAQKTSLTELASDMSYLNKPSMRIDQLMPRLESDNIRFLPASCDVFLTQDSDDSSGDRDSGAIDLAWLLLLAGLAVLRPCLRHRLLR